MFRLALACGRWDVDDFIGEMDARQWAEWVAYDRLEPIGEKRADLRNAMHLAHILRTLAAMAGGDPGAIQERNFLPYLHELAAWDEPEQDPRLTMLALEMAAKRFNAQQR